MHEGKLYRDVYQPQMRRTWDRRLRTEVSTMKAPVRSSARYGDTRGWIFKSSNGSGDKTGGSIRPPGSMAESLRRCQLESSTTGFEGSAHPARYAFPHHRSTEPGSDRGTGCTRLSRLLHTNKLKAVMETWIVCDLWTCFPKSIEPSTSHHTIYIESAKPCK